MMKITKEIMYSSLLTPLFLGVYFLRGKSLPNEIVSIARSYLGVREVGSSDDKNFSDPVFTQKLREIGWTSGTDWCNFFSKLVLLEAFAKKGLSEQYNYVKRIFTPSTQQTWRLLQQNPRKFFSIEVKPHKGDIIFFRKVGSKYHGHSGVVERVLGDRVQTIEGNLRNGVNRAIRYVTYKQPQGSMWLLGFVRFK